MLELFQFLAALSAGLFAGAALYISVVEHPARMMLDTRAAVTQWALSYKRATWLQAPLASISLVCGAAVWLMGAGAAWLAAALAIGAVVPFTFIVVMPTNHQILAPRRDLDSVETRTVLTRWGKLHAVRSALGFVAAGLDLWLLRGA